MGGLIVSNSGCARIAPFLPGGCMVSLEPLVVSSVPGPGLSPWIRDLPARGAWIPKEAIKFGAADTIASLIDIPSTILTHVSRM